MCLTNQSGTPIRLDSCNIAVNENPIASINGNIYHMFKSSAIVNASAGKLVAKNGRKVNDLVPFGNSVPNLLGT